jgi:hypothetical protein
MHLITLESVTNRGQISKFPTGTAAGADGPKQHRAMTAATLVLATQPSWERSEAGSATAQNESQHAQRNDGPNVKVSAHAIDTRNSTPWSAQLPSKGGQNTGAGGRSAAHRELLTKELYQQTIVRRVSRRAMIS